MKNPNFEDKEFGQRIWRFDNGYGASVVNHSFSRGTELAVVRFTGPDIRDITLVYNTPITDDVVGHLTESAVQDLLKAIEQLPDPNENT